MGDGLLVRYRDALSEASALRATLAGANQRIATLEAEVAEARGAHAETLLSLGKAHAELAAMRPKAAAAYRTAAERRRDSLRRSTSPVPHGTFAWSAAYDAAQSRVETERQGLIAACPEKGGAG